MAKNKENNENKKGLNPIVLVILIVVVLGGGAFGGTYLFMQNNAEAKEKVVEVKVPIIEEITVNLSDSSSFVKTGVYLSYDESNSDLGDEITNKTVEIQDKTTFFLKSRKIEDFDASNEAQLKEELIESINSVLEKGKIENVYFPTGILVQ